MLLSQKQSSKDGKARDATRRAFSLIEITAALVLMGLLAVVSSRYFTKGAMQATETVVTAQTLQLDLERIRCTAIETGEPHGLRFDRSGSAITSVIPYQRTTGGEKQVASAKPVPDSVSITFKGRAIEFNSEGATSNGQTILLKSPTRSWQIDVVAITGTIRLQEL